MRSVRLFVSAMGLTLACIGLAMGDEPRSATVDSPSQPASPTGKSASLDGDWSYHVGDLDSPPRSIPAGLPVMRVPSNWYAEGVDHAGVVWLFREVDCDSNMERGALDFDAVDYAADVYWDGERLGGHRGYFAPFRVEIGRVEAGSHLLAVRVDSPNEAKEAWSLRKTLIKGVLSHHDTRPGGAWSERGQDANTGGIWGSVRLTDIRSGSLSDVRIATLEATDERARISIRASADVEPETELDYVIRDGERLVASGVVGTKSAAPGRVELETEIVIERPRLWWPRELGEPHLYTVELRLEGPRGADVKTETFGVRTVAMDAQRRLIVNGRPVFLRGTNYIGTLYYGSFSRAALRRDLELMVAANVNAVRVHAHVAGRALYRLADEMGILLWQDFPLQWGYDDSEAFAQEAARQAVDMVSLLYNHPSIVFWSGANELPWSSDWMAWKYSDYNPDQNRRLGRALEETLRRQDPTRPSQGNAHPAEHGWSGWYSGSYRDFARPTAQAILTEYGAQAVPDKTTLRTFLGESELWPIEGDNLATWSYHNFQLRELREIAKVPLGGSADELIANTQGYQAKLLQFAAESLRRQKWQPVTGLFQFMFVEHWPSMSWGIVDHLRRPKLGYAALARAYQPVLAIASEQPKRSALTLDIVNDRDALAMGARLVVSYAPALGAADIDIPVEIPGNDVVRLEGSIPTPAEGQALHLSLRDASGRSLSENDYAPGYFSP